MSRTSAADQRRRSSLRRSLAAALLLPALAGGFALQALGGRPGEQVFHEVITALSARGLDTIPDAQLYEKAARGLLAQIGDPYAELFSPEQLAQFSRETLRNSYGGVGMQITTVRDTALVTRVFEGSPAARGGVQPGDRVISAAGENVTGLGVDQVTRRLLGEPGTTVAVDYHRPGVGTIHHEFTRERIRYPSVAYAVMLEEGIGYVPLEGFNDTSGEEVLRALVGLRKSGAHSFVLDLRGNGGGSLEQAIRISDLFLNPGQSILRAEFRNAPDENVLARTEAVVPDAPLVVLTDEVAASASEIVAGALQDHDRAVIIGETTFGKGLVQDIFRLEGGWALKLTTGRWYTPSGRTIQRPRRLNPEGRLVEIPTDSVANRPVFRSDAGRVVYGGGGITPDLHVDDDTLAGAERALAVALGPRAGEFNAAMQEMAVDRAPGLPEGFRATPEWRADLYARLAKRGVTVDRRTWDAGSTLIDRVIEDRVSGYAFGQAAAFRRGVARDAQLQAALRVLRGAATQTEALARVPTGAPAGA
jgi:carboxyl-terminal processing protease